MMLSPKKKAIAFSSVLLIVSAAFVVTAAASTDGVLAPFRNGEDFPHERPLSRHGVALGVVVGQVQAAADDASPSRGPRSDMAMDRRIAPVEGALVEIRAVSDQVSNDVQASKETNARGIAVFHLRPGGYEVSVTTDAGKDSHLLRVFESKRVNVVWDDEGQAHWVEADHKQLEKRGDARGFVARAVDVSSGSRQPIEGAVVTVYEWSDSGRGEAVASKETGPRGAAAFPLHRGGYEIVVQWDGLEQSKVVRVPGAGMHAFAFGQQD